MSKIFISYNRESEAIVKTLADDLDALGHSVWLDQELSGGQSWWDHILSNIRQCDIFIFALSNETLNSVACKREYLYGFDLGKPILPVRVGEGISINLLPPALSKLQIVDYRKKDRDAAIRLARSLGSIPPPGPLPDPLPPPPEAPISYLGSLTEKIGTTSTLTYEEQSILIVDLKRGLRDSEITVDARTLLERLRRRRDLLASIAEEIDELLERKEAPPRETIETTTKESPTSDGLTASPTQKTKTRLKETHLAAIWLGCAAGFVFLSIAFFETNNIRWFGIPSDDVSGLFFGALVGIGSGIFLAGKRWPAFEGAELAIYWLGCAAGFVFLSIVFFETNNIRWFGLPSDGESGLFFGAIVALGSGMYLKRLWKAKILGSGLH
ncbi:MAG: toll/interleukin-1 receptor domain-containing protein [Gammaproteobacteria bacterium]|nr:toll/interleukin-1 receptor domain-containing protein [Gammaproteobacteria bacterium]